MLSFGTDVNGYVCLFFFFQAEDGIRDLTVTGVQTCALPIYEDEVERGPLPAGKEEDRLLAALILHRDELLDRRPVLHLDEHLLAALSVLAGDGRAKVGGEVLAAGAHGRPSGGGGFGLTPGPAKDRLDQSLGNPALGLQEIHHTSGLPVRSVRG